jgi:hypothetical protein
MCHLVAVSMKAVLINHMTKTLYLFIIEFTFFCTKVQRMLTKLVKHKLQMFLVFFNCVAKHEDVIQVCMDEYSNVISEDRVHQPLEG